MLPAKAAKTDKEKAAKVYSFAAFLLESALGGQPVKGSFVRFRHGEFRSGAV
ncbi:hypothetical protein [Allofournierella massiliensis]|uniref:Uncharacterized protein n=1 Tax=Allofournierella massiliensis TaxID=1650663 RepID=A0ABT7UP26_9FIRM|nr:hypothetical protein [Fournierella massiliensis]MDM8200636.1 hypothetical protein [Fournierella massiliensis]